MAYFRCELIVGGHSYEATDDLVNWEDVELAYKRADLDGVVRNFSTKFEFANGAYSLLLGEYRANYLQAPAQVVFYTRNNSWLWNELFRCALDFSTFSYTGTTCEVNAVDDSLASLIKAKRGTEYEYSVANIREAEQLWYDGILMSSQCKWKWQGTDEDGMIYADYTHDDHGGVNQRAQMAVYMLSSEFPFANRLEAYDGGVMVTDYGNSHTFTYDELMQYAIYRSTSPSPLTVHVKVDLHLKVEGGTAGKSNTIFYLEHVNGDGSSSEVIYDASLINGSTTHVDYEEDIVLNNGDFIAMWLFIGASVRISQSTDDAEEDVVEISTTLRNSPQLIDAVKPSTLLNRLLRSMNGGEEGITGEIAEDVDARLENTLLLAAESVRGLDGAKLRTSYTKFCDWMSAEFGFVPVVDDGAKKVTFVHRDSLFKDTEVKDLGDSCTEFRYTVNEGLIYARVRVGYDKVDYDSVNGRDEFRWTNSYETGVTLTDTSLDLISPYRADAYGIEFLAAKRGEDTTDDGSDNDVFMAGAALNSDGTRYELVRGGDYAVTGVISPGTMFNGMYAQRFMVAANEKYIGVFADGLAFASAEGNGEAAVGGVRTDADLAITGRLFTVGEVEVETGDQSLPSDLGGYFRLEKNGATYKGYLKEVGFGVGKAQAVGYTLIVKEVVD